MDKFIRCFVKSVGFVLIAWSIKELLLPAINLLARPEFHHSFWLPNPVAMGVVVAATGLALVAWGAFLIFKKLPD